MHTKFIPASLLRVLMMVSVLCAPAALSQDIAQDDAQADATDTVANIATDDSTNFAKDMPAAYVTSSHQILPTTARSRKPNPARAPMAAACRSRCSAWR